MFCECEQVLMRAEQVAAQCGVAKVTWWRWNASGMVPAGLKIGGARLWRRAEILEWVQAGSPNREKWQAIQNVVKRSPK